MTTLTPTIVIVDTHPSDYKPLFARFREFEFRTIESGEEAMRLSRPAQDQLWLVNVELPDCCGLEFASLIRQRSPTTPVYAVGNAYRQEDELAAAQAGVSGYVCKPADPSWLSSLRLKAGAGPPGQSSAESPFTLASKVPIQK